MKYESISTRLVSQPMVGSHYVIHNGTYGRPAS
uniref:Uncharacterized protein n=1 Tax=Anguilla anguilla TaxID=7936 RepID=A0A0E9SCS7_ANGAN